MSVRQFRFKVQGGTIFRFFSTKVRPSPQVRVRFAPSPTGYLHLGGLRTALYNFLFAQSQGGRFILRIEDTDRTRLVQGAAQKLEDDLKWAGIQPDESPLQGGDFGPYIQSERKHLYREYTDILLEKGAAYPCFCTEQRLELLRREALRMQAVPRYDNRCQSLDPEDVKKQIERGDPHCIRFKLQPGPDTFQDIIYSSISVDTALNEGDPVILKGDGFPTYHLACVVDDHLMKVSHVLRGVEWQMSTGKHLQMHRAFGWQPPEFGHLPLLLNPDGTKLSKRQGDIHIDHYRKSGIFPEVLLSFMSHFGGGFRRESLKPHVHTLSDLVHQFDLSLLSTSPCRVEVERLYSLNKKELEERLKSPEQVHQFAQKLRDIVVQHFDGRLSCDSPSLASENLTKIILWGLPRISSLEELVNPGMSFLWTAPPPDILLTVAVPSYEAHAETLEKLSSLLDESLSKSTVGSKEEWIKLIKNHCVILNVDFRLMMKILRAALSGVKAGPPIGEVIDLIGPSETLCRLRLAAKTLREQATKKQHCKQ